MKLTEALTSQAHFKMASKEKIYCRCNEKKELKYFYTQDSLRAPYSASFSEEEVGAEDWQLIEDPHNEGPHHLDLGRIEDQSLPF